MAAIFSGLTLAGERGAVALVDGEGRVIASSNVAALPLDTAVEIGIAGGPLPSESGGREVLAVTCPTRGYQGYMGAGWCGYAMVPVVSAFRQDAAVSNTGHPRSDHQQREQSGRGAQRFLSASAALNAIEDEADEINRNLYERANDCRWRALSPDLLRLLSTPASAENARAINAIFDHVNALYTVYSKLLVFDADGMIRGASRHRSALDDGQWVGQPIDAALLEDVLALEDSQRYAVSEFVPTALYAGRPTYVYAAALRDGHARGGIAIVFGGEAEFAAMLQATIVGQPGAVAAYVDGRGCVVSCSDPRFRVCEALPFANTASRMAYDGREWACATAAAGGYREFKRTDGYRNDVSAVVAMPLGLAAPIAEHAGAGASPAHSGACRRWQSSRNR